MKKTMIAVAAVVATALPALSEPTKGYYTYDAMGCMLLQECTKDVERINNLQDLANNYPITDYSIIADEFDSMVRSLHTIGVKVFLAHPKYFPPNHRGVYHTVGNNFFLNKDFMHDPGTLMSVMRHEGWHAAQDCMAGTIDNSMIAIIKNEEDVPMLWREMAQRTYPESALPWEAEASWAGRTVGMTQAALESCARGSMWTDYTPTPMTRKWLIQNGYITK